MKGAIMFEQSLTSLDGSEYDEKTLAAAGELAGLTAGTIRVLHVREGDFIGRAGFAPARITRRHPRWSIRRSKT
jgi:hypothetical protein